MHYGVLQEMIARPKLISDNCLSGEECPSDLQRLVSLRPDLLGDLGIRLGGERGWSPWLDRSNLSAEDLNNPDIRDHLKALDEVCEYIRFIAQLDNGEFIGYWVSPSNTPVEKSPLVCLNTCGEFEICGARFIESLFFYLYGDDLTKLREAAKELSIPLGFTTLRDIKSPECSISPDDFYDVCYERKS